MWADFRQWLAGVASWPELDPDEREAFRDEAAATNITRLKILLPLMFLLHLAHVWVFWLPAAERVAAEPIYVAWRDAVVGTHLVTAVLVAMVLGWIALRNRVGGTRWLGVSAGMLYLMHAAAIAAADQLNAPNVSPYMAYSLTVAFFLALEPVEIAVLWPTGLVAFVVAILGFQADPDVRLTLLPNGPSVTLASIVLATLLYGVRRREFAQRLIIARQRRELEALNAGLERQVADQVAVIVARADEVEKLNAQLQEQVRDRSRELARALERLAAQTLTEWSLAPGTVLGGRFELGKSLGVGGMGAVYEATDNRTGEPVAVKLIRTSSTVPLEMLRRFLREARTAAAVTHPGIVRMIAIDISEEGVFYQVQELVPGRTLRAVLRRRGALDAGLVCRILAALCDALAEAHRRGVIHRDIKPANIMLTPIPPGLKLVDFGISKERVLPLVMEDEQTPTLLPGDEATRMGVLLGTPNYMGPELANGSHAATDRSDVYAVGVVGVEMLTGSLGDRATRPLRDRLTTLPERIATPLSQCLAAPPTSRPSAAELATAFEETADALAAESLVTWTVSLDEIRRS